MQGSADFEPQALATVAGEPAAVVSAAVAAGIEVGLLETVAGSVTFRHALIRDAVLDASVPHALQVLHERAAAALAAGSADATTLERRARHLEATGDVDTAAELLATAAALRLHDHALLGAEALASRAFGLAGSPKIRGGVGRLRRCWRRAVGRAFVTTADRSYAEDARGGAAWRHYDQAASRARARARADHGATSPQIRW